MTTMEDTPTPYEALEMAVDILGTQAALARTCGVTTTAVWKWVQSSKRLPAEFVLAVEAATGVPRHHLRPDIYPADLGPSPSWHGVDRSIHRVSFNQTNGLKRGAAA
jgi:DNA-binding transcriptional regulator YdaS (Cro superfamily)